MIRISKSQFFNLFLTNQPKIMSTRKVISICVFLASLNIFSQFKVDADIRNRFEYRHGFNNLFPNDADPAAFDVQRTRLNIFYKADKLTVMMSFQDVSTWGDTPQIAATDSNNSFSLFQGWFQYELTDTWALKMGRQVLSYDSQRILGGLDWAMQGRFHDLALFKYKKDNLIMDFGLAFSQENQRREDTDFLLQGAFTYKTMQFAYLRKNFEKGALSFLFLNNGFQNLTEPNNTIADGISNKQTSGFYYKFPLSNIQLEGHAYYQFGQHTKTTDMAAYNLGLEGIYKPNTTAYGLGFEILSGTDQAGSSKNNSFFPLYGTNHKFNGFMDYFFVGNHANNVGLNDFYAKAVFKTGEKSNVLTKIHYFGANADFLNGEDKYLGTEIDLVFTQKIAKDIKMNIGYSHMFASESMSLIKDGRPSDNTNNWAWLQFTIQPTIFSSSK